MSLCVYCGSPEKCYPDCDCQKCLNPARYKRWKETHPEGFRNWQEQQKDPAYVKKKGEAIADARDMLKKTRKPRESDQEK